MKFIPILINISKSLDIRHMIKSVYQKIKYLILKCNSGAKSCVYTDPRHIINYPVEKIYIEKVDTIEYSENENNKYQLSYISSPREALGDNVFWSVDNVEVADIDYNGVLTVKAPGRVKVTAFLQSNDRIFCRREIKII